jgi:hypothetical protein
VHGGNLIGPFGAIIQVVFGHHDNTCHIWQPANDCLAAMPPWFGSHSKVIWENKLSTSSIGQNPLGIEPNMSIWTRCPLPDMDDITCFTVTLPTTATLTGPESSVFKYEGSDSEIKHLIYLLYDVSRGLILWLSRLERSQKWIFFKTRRSYACFLSASLRSCDANLTRKPDRPISGKA